MVLSIEAKQQSPGNWEVYTDCGRERSGKSAVEWARQAVNLGAGEVLVTSIDTEGTRRGFDLDLVREITGAIEVPVIASGGYGEAQHLRQVVEAGADAVAFADALHYGRTSLPEIRQAAGRFGIRTRMAS